MPTTPHSNDPRDHLGDYVLGKDGKPLVDRYGRPVHRRAGERDESARGAQTGRPAQDRPTYQPRRTPHQQRQEVARAAQQNQTRYEPPQPAQSRPVQSPPARSRPAQYQQQPRYQEPVPYQVQYQPEYQAPVEVRGKRRRRKAKAPGCFAVILTLVVLLIAGTLVTDARLSRIQALPATQIPQTSGTNWLLVGSDSRTGMSQKEIDRLGTGGDIGSTRTDTIMLLHLPRAGKATLMSIPRDSYVQVPGVGYDKINAAFAFGGPQLLVQTVEQATGLHVDRYAEIGMRGLADVVDAVGGVEICVSEPIDDPLANLNVQPGCQVMNGATGLGYVRTRATAQGDLDRVARQREFLTALVSKVMSPATLLNPFKVVPLAWDAPEMFVVGRRDHVWNLARIAWAMHSGLDTVTIPVGDFMDTEVGNVVVWDQDAAEALFQSLR